MEILFTILSNYVYTNALEEPSRKATLRTMAKSSFVATNSSTRPRLFTTLVVLFSIALSLSVFQAIKLTIHDQHFVDDMRVIRVREETVSQVSLSTVSLPSDIWANDYLSAQEPHQLMVRDALDDQSKEEALALCGRTLYHSLTRGFVRAEPLGEWTFVATGDIPDMWIRDSSVQIGAYLSKIRRHPFLRGLIQGTLRTQAFLIVQDPYANAFSPEWRDSKSHDKFGRLLGRGGWVATRNYELDSSVYFIQFLWNYVSHNDIHRSEKLLEDPIFLDAIQVIIDTMIVEQHHETESPYRYSELQRDGLGPKTGYTGMTWSGFRPSDDTNRYGYSIPSNVYAASSLYKVLEMNKIVWKEDSLRSKVETLLADIEQGIEKHGIVEVEPGVHVYAYEVDGLGGVLADFDDANLPSLLSLPLLGWPKLDSTVYQATRERLLNPNHNPQYFNGTQIRGIGSEHTSPGNVWPLAMMTEVMTDTSVDKKASIIKDLLKTQCNNGLMHESINSNLVSHCTRPEFEWANIMFAVLIERELGYDCDKAAMEHLKKMVMDKEQQDSSSSPTNHGKAIPAYYAESFLEYFINSKH